MSQSSSRLSQQLAGLSDRFSELGERLLTAARQLHAPGTPPAEPLIEEVGACRRDFFALRDRALELAQSLQVACPAPEQLGNLHDLTALLDQAAESEVRLAKSEELRRRALSVLDRVLALSHATAADFAPLHECQRHARSLREGIADSAWSSLPPEAGRLAEGDHHFAGLLTLVDNHDELNDDLWAELHESVSQAFGKPLAAAVARSKLVLPAHLRGGDPGPEHGGHRNGSSHADRTHAGAVSQGAHH
jgi:hypothetical protein